MKKVSLLAASVAIALTGCGGSDSGSGSNDNVAPGGVIVTGFDGYFNQAVVFDDINNNGQLDLDSDNVFGLTNQKGQITLAKDTEIKGSLALKTLRPGDVEKELAVKLAALSPENDTYSDFMNTYTTDMDHEGQPMANSVVFRAPIAGEKADSNMVISPITDLVAIEMGKNANLSLEEASVNVSTLLGATDEQPINPFSDFVKDAKTNLASAQLHKTAQILTESKAKNPTEYTKNATAIASTAKDEAKEIVTESNIGTDEVLNTTPVINPSKPEVAVTNYKLLVNAAAKAELTHTFAALDIQEGVVATHTITLPENLFIDRFEGRETPVAASDATINGKGIILTLNNGVITLTTEAALLTQDKFTVTVTADDRATANGEVLNKLSETFSFTVELSNTAPEVDGDVQTSLQTHIDSWKLAQGVEFKNELDMSGLFTDREGDELTITTNINTVIPGLTSTFDKATGKLTISGRPASAHPAQRFTVIANDGHVATRIESHPASFDLPAVTQGEIKTNATVLAELKAEASTWELQVGQAFEQTLDISKLFEDSISGDVEYYAHYAAHDDTPAKNPIPGVKVSVDASGLVSLTGTPTAETNGVILYVAKGINFSGGKENDVESEMVEILLPNVQPSDDITPPPPENKLAFTKEHFNNQVWRMGSFADRDGEIAYASLMTNAQGGLEWCWGDNHGQYSSNISDYNGNNPFAVLRDLDNKTDYLESQAKDCWAVTINTDGTLLDADNQPYEMLYQHSPAAGEYQILVKMGTQELFWMDSTNTPLAQVLPVAPKLAASNVEFDLSVESGAFNPELDGPELSYAMGSYTFKANNRFVNESIKPTGFYTTGSWEQTYDSNNDVRAELTEEMEDQKTRVRYINREFGDFYIAVTWSEDQGGTSAPQYSLFGYDQDIMTSVFSELPIMK